MLDVSDKRPTIYLGDPEAEWVKEQAESDDQSKSGVIRAAVRVAKDNPDQFQQEVEDL